MVIKGLPKDFGYKMPAEWEKHFCTLMAWPIIEADWPGSIEEIYKSYADAVNKISNFEKVKLIVKPHLIPLVKEYICKDIDIIMIDYDDSWTRDNGPTMVINSNNEIAGVNWIFNAWGGKYPHENDNLIATKVLELMEISIFNAPIVMEGGSLQTDGEGTLLTTKECLLNKNRNPDITKDEIEKYLEKYLGIEKIIWFDTGLYGDDTDGHIDNVACFAKPGVILIQVCRDIDDPNYSRTLNNLEILKNVVDARGRNFEIIEIEQPKPQFYDDNLLTLSYLNFYFVNGGIILPTFGGENIERDKAAENILKKVFFNRKIETIDGLTLARGGGNIHCLTQQFPEGI